jgi:hypothetical protein
VLASLFVGLMFLSVASGLFGYSVLSHEAIIDTVWAPVIVPMLLRRYPRTTRAMLREAHAYAYGGSEIQDLGYYPFGNRFFSNLTHYVRSGDFVSALIEQSRNVNEYAFALGALSHYVADNTGHPLAVNRSVPALYPALKRKYGSVVTYEDDPQAHVMVEFSFDVVQVAGAGYLPKTYHNFIGFKVARGLLARAFQSTYGLKLKQHFLWGRLSLPVYREGASEVIPRMTQMVWHKKRKAILKVNPQLARTRFGYRLSPENYQGTWNGSHRRPRFFLRRWEAARARISITARVSIFLLQIMPKVGRLRTLQFKPLTPRTQAMFIRSFGVTVERYKAALAQVSHDDLAFTNRDLDTGQPTRAGAYAMADQTYSELLRRLAHRRFASVSPQLRAALLSFYHSWREPIATRGISKRRRVLLHDLEQLKAYSAGATQPVPPGGIASTPLANRPLPFVRRRIAGRVATASGFLAVGFVSVGAGIRSVILLPIFPHLPHLVLH